MLFCIDYILFLIFIDPKAEKKKWKEINQIKKTKGKNRILKRKSVVVHQVVVQVVVGKNYYFIKSILSYFYIHCFIALLQVALVLEAVLQDLVAVQAQVVLVPVHVLAQVRQVQVVLQVLLLLEPKQKQSEFFTY